MNSTLEGGCACGACRYELHSTPLITHACHCTDCQRASGAPFAVNIWTEAENVVLQSGKLRSVLLEGGASGKPCEVWFCEVCGTALWSRYHVSPGDCRWVRGGTLDDPASIAPDVHIWTRSKMPFVTLPDDVPIFEQFYDLKEVWSADSLGRLRANIEAHAQ
ncbi:MAG: GFA family protein [Woeseiaceae bacterium]|nr:GFA family protein [Woeseiaceae bacterium]